MVPGTWHMAHGRPAASQHPLLGPGTPEGLREAAPPPAGSGAGPAWEEECCHFCRRLEETTEATAGGAGQEGAQVTFWRGRVPCADCGCGHTAARFSKPAGGTWQSECTCHCLTCVSAHLASERPHPAWNLCVCRFVRGPGHSVLERCRRGGSPRQGPEGRPLLSGPATQNLALCGPPASLCLLAHLVSPGHRATHGHTSSGPPTPV